MKTSLKDHRKMAIQMEERLRARYRTLSAAADMLKPINEHMSTVMKEGSNQVGLILSDFLEIYWDMFNETKDNNGSSKPGSLGPRGKSILEEIPSEDEDTL